MGFVPCCPEHAINRAMICQPCARLADAYRVGRDEAEVEAALELERLGGEVEMLECALDDNKGHLAALVHAHGPKLSIARDVVEQAERAGTLAIREIVRDGEHRIEYELVPRVPIDFGALKK